MTRFVLYGLLFFSETGTTSCVPSGIANRRTLPFKQIHPEIKYAPCQAGWPQEIHFRLLPSFSRQYLWSMHIYFARFLLSHFNTLLTNSSRYRKICLPSHFHIWVWCVFSTKAVVLAELSAGAMNAMECRRAIMNGVKTKRSRGVLSLPQLSVRNSNMSSENQGHSIHTPDTQYRVRRPGVRPT